MKSYTLVSGASMPGLGLGTWQSDPGVVGKAVKDAIAVGYRHIDCAAIYGNEPEIGGALQEVFRGTAETKKEDDSAMVIHRSDLFVTSKLWNTMHRAESVEPALRKTLSDLGLDYLDLYLIHWPVAMDHGDNNNGSFLPLDQVPIADTWKAMEDCVDKGLVKDIGVSNFSVHKLKQLLQTARIRPSVNQVERHPYLQNPELYQFCQDNGILITAYSPLGTPGTPFANKSVEPILENPVIINIAAKHGITPAQVLILWALECGTSVIPKSTKRHRMVENLVENTSSRVVLDQEDMNQIKAIDKHHRYVDGSFWCKEGSPYTLDNLWDEGHIMSATTRDTHAEF